MYIYPLFGNSMCYTVFSCILILLKPESGKMEIQNFKLKHVGFTGRLYRPGENKFPGKALLIVGGGDGLYSITKAVAAYFAKNGLTALALAY